MKIVYLDEGSVGDACLDGLRSLGEYTGYHNSTREESLERVRDCEVLIINKVAVDAVLMDRAPKLRLVCVSATGTDNIDLDAAAARGIIVRNVAGYSTESVVQATFTHLLSLLGRSAYFDAYVKDGRYSEGGLFTNSLMPFTELAGKAMGIVGMGTIGSRVAQVACAFGMDVAYYSTSGTSHCTAYPSLPLGELLRRSDVVSIHAPLNSRTGGLIGKAELAMMKPGAVLLNLGRGGILDEEALAAALDAGTIAGAALDVYSREPLPSDSPLLHLLHPERISLSPHRAWASRESLSRLLSAVEENIRKGW
ncbi:MAG: hydroxyacid dehydrogenase [Bacteroides sp. CAG:1060_57_27]|nr:MAG: hydroxyacid dehydrogenase [Bacteroides sp. CAG:1060_57_27]